MGFNEKPDFNLEQSTSHNIANDRFEEVRASLSLPETNWSIANMKGIESYANVISDGALVIPPLFKNAAGANNFAPDASNSTYALADLARWSVSESLNVSTYAEPGVVQPEKITDEYLKKIDGKDTLREGEKGFLHYKVEAPLKEQKDGTFTSTTPDGCSITVDKEGTKIEVKEPDGTTRTYSREPQRKIVVKDKEGKETVYDNIDTNTEDKTQPVLLNRFRDGGTSTYKLPDGTTVTFGNKGGEHTGFKIQTSKGVSIETSPRHKNAQFTRVRDDDE